ncbi:hypothetical protein BD324DRAFT_650172 [Kockovaella imperatae]|uniref:Aminoglycoside phosphotransferase domain-containing protein n=1 Tax=Kockovaella imperatae TaxID=4999 RepID=A0A1Y1UHV2_9TREE|nr:hypothetical protein BD324DRAFT_650172 [Kockovaella imperatae]ORX37602.1 hypothetical protein BD324DRAFT_650172 [Kockovaella imperatae]
MAYPFQKMCTFPGCDRKTRGPAAMCTELCEAFLCPAHRKPEFHPCLLLTGITTMKEQADLWATASIQDWVMLHESMSREAIEGEASRLRPGHSCVLNAPQDGTVGMFLLEQATTDEDNLRLTELWRSWTPLETGGMSHFNHHYQLTFDDGVKWMLRCKRLRADRPASDYILFAVMKSEIQTMDFLREAGLKIPKVYRPSGTIKAPITEKHRWRMYFFSEYITATKLPLQVFPVTMKEDRLKGLSLTVAKQVVRFYAEQMILISHKPFSAMGSLYPGKDGGPAYVGPMIDPWIGFRKKPYFYGPFTHPRDRWLTFINHQLDLALNHHGFNGDPIDNYLLLRDLMAVIEEWKELDKPATEFYVKHVDSKGDMLFIEPDGSIAAWIDWEWAIVRTKEEAFAAPLLKDTYEELGRSDLAACVKKGFCYPSLIEVCSAFGPDLRPAYEYKKVRGLLLGTGGGTKVSIKAAKEWLQGLRQTYRDDPGYQQVLASQGRMSEASVILEASSSNPTNA